MESLIKRGKYDSYESHESIAIQFKVTKKADNRLPVNISMVIYHTKYFSLPFLSSAASLLISKQFFLEASVPLPPHPILV